MASTNNRVLYTGVTSDLRKRVYQHKEGKGSHFTGKYQVKKLVYYEIYEDIHHAIAREKQIKSGPRRKKIELIERMNPGWRDLADELG